VRHLLLVSRQGPAASGAAELARELREAGAEVSVRACDVSDREALRSLLSGIPAEHPLRAVVHTAGVLDDGLLESLTTERIDRVLGPKLDAAVYLHELTAQLELSAFVLFSSLAGVLGSMGQSHYAAANSFLDALAHERRARGLAGTALAWGFWAERSALTAQLSAVDLARMASIGLQPMSSEDGLALFDAALDSAVASLVPAHLNVAALHSPDALPPVLRALAPSRPARSTKGVSQLRSLRELSGDARVRAVTELVRDEVAHLLGQQPSDVPLDCALLELGLTSLSAVEIRRKLNTLTGAALTTRALLEGGTLRSLSDSILDTLAREVSVEGRADSTRVPQAPTALASLVEQAGSSGETATAWQLMSLTARVRRAREIKTASTLPARTQPQRLAAGPERPALFCIPALPVPTGAMQYAHLGAALRDRRDVWVLPNPGFSHGEQLPADVETIAEIHAQAAQRCAAGAPFALLGLSSGGCVAHCVVNHLERSGIFPSALVLLDSFVPRDTPDSLLKVVEQRWWQGLSLGAHHDDELTAMSWYFDLFRSWAPASIETPIVLARAMRAIGPLDSGSDGAGEHEHLATWAQPHSVIDIPGDHYTITGSDAVSTADAIHRWLLNLTLRCA
jgi:NAD(P)-dependent dehydrogenase (short-subunit alcohol dehydrogenase family)